MPKTKTMEFEEWREKYCPIEEDETGYVKVYETYGADLEMIKLIPENFVWTLVDDGTDDGFEVIVAGKHLVNRMGYIICQNSWEKKNIIAEW